MWCRKSPGHPAFIGLMYHDVVRDEVPADLSPSITSYCVDQAVFAAQMREVAAQSGWCLRADDLGAFYADSQCTSRPGYPVLLTFDDGWLGSVDVAGPVLEQSGYQAFVFVTTDFVGRRYFLDRNQLRRVPPGQFRVGSHCRTHRMLSRLGESEVRAELHDSKAFLEDVLSMAVETVSIPGGAVDERVQRIAAKVGYRYLFTSEVHVNRRTDSPLAIGRVAVKRNTSLRAFRRYVRQRVAPEQLRRALLRLPKRCLGLARYERLRRWLLWERQGQLVTHEP